MSRISDHRAGSKGRRRHEEILEVAAQLFSVHGYEPTTIQDIADSIGVTKASLYYYIESKEELLFRVLLRNHDELHRHVVDEAFYTELRKLEKVGVFVNRHVLYVLTHRAASSLYGDDAHVVRSVKPWWESLVAARRTHENFLLQLIRDAQDAGDAGAATDPALTTRALLSMANSVVRWFRADGPYSPEMVAANHADLAVRSLRPEVAACCPLS